MYENAMSFDIDLLKSGLKLLSYVMPHYGVSLIGFVSGAFAKDQLVLLQAILSTRRV